MSTIVCTGVNLAVLFDKRERYVKKAKNRWSRAREPCNGLLI